MDMAAAKLGLDAKEIRLRNLIAADELPYKVASGIVWDKSGFQECLQAACGAIGYDALRAKQKQARAAGRWVGIGIASYAELTGIGSRISVAPGMPINTGTETAIDPHRFDRRRHRRVRHRLARAGPRDDARPGRRRASRRPCRGYPRRAGRQRRASPAAPAPMPAAAWCWPAAQRRLPRGRCAKKCLMPPRICSKPQPPILSRKTEKSPSPAPIVRSRFATWRAPSIPKWAGCRPTRATSSPPPRPTIRCSAPRPRRRTSPPSRSIRRPMKSASSISPSPRIAASWSIR